MQREVAALSAAYATGWWRTGPSRGWPLLVTCTSAVRLGSWRTQLMAELDRPPSTRSDLASHSGRQHIILGPLVAQILITLNASSLADRVNMTKRVLQTQIRFPKATTVQGVVHLAHVATAQGEGDAHRGRTRCICSAPAHMNGMWVVW